MENHRAETNRNSDKKRRKWNWIEHTLRKEAEAIEKTASYWNPQGYRRRCRPKRMWRRTIEDKIRNTGRLWNEVKGIAGDRNAWKLFMGVLCSTRSKRNWWWWCITTHNNSFSSKLYMIGLRIFKITAVVCIFVLIWIFQCFDFPAVGMKPSLLELRFPSPFLCYIHYLFLLMFLGQGGNKRPGPTSSVPSKKRKCGICKQEGKAVAVFNVNP